MTPPDPRQVERFVDAAVRDLPARPAPTSLERRVHAELARRSRLPWWRKSFLSWPLGARAVFVVCCAVIVRLVFMAEAANSTIAFTTQVRSSVDTHLANARAATNLVQTLFESAHAIYASVPALWLYGGAAIVGGLYLALFGLGAAAYRTLYVSR